MLVTSTTGSSATGDGTVRMKEPLMQSQRLAPPAPATLCCGRVPVRGILVVVGGFLMHMTLGTQLTYGEACWSVLLPVCVSVCLIVVRQCVCVPQTSISGTNMLSASNRSVLSVNVKFSDLN